MRTIKFRAWIKKDKTMFYQNDQYIASFIRRAVLLITGTKTHESYVKGGLEQYLMQYTGLKDKKGVEIFEGDICHFLRKDNISYDNDQERTFTVIWDNKQGRWGVIDSQIPLAHFEQDNLEVIGNIYSNKELLK